MIGCEIELLLPVVLQGCLIVLINSELAWQQLSLETLRDSHGRRWSNRPGQSGRHEL